MNKCHVCGSSEIHNELIDEIFYISGKPVLVEHIPTKVCHQYGELFAAPSTVALLQQIILDDQKLKRVIQTPVYSYVA